MLASRTAVRVCRGLVVPAASKIWTSVRACRVTTGYATTQLQLRKIARVLRVVLLVLSNVAQPLDPVCPSTAA